MHLGGPVGRCIAAGRILLGPAVRVGAGREVRWGGEIGRGGVGSVVEAEGVGRWGVEMGGRSTGTSLTTGAMLRMMELGDRGWDRGVGRRVAEGSQ